MQRFARLLFLPSPRQSPSLTGCTLDTRLSVEQQERVDGIPLGAEQRTRPSSTTRVAPSPPSPCIQLIIEFGTVLHSSDDFNVLYQLTPTTSPRAPHCCPPIKQGLAQHQMTSSLLRIDPPTRMRTALAGTAGGRATVSVITASTSCRGCLGRRVLLLRQSCFFIRG